MDRDGKRRPAGCEGMGRPVIPSPGGVLQEAELARLKWGLTYGGRDVNGVFENL